MSNDPRRRGGPTPAVPRQPGPPTEGLTDALIARSPVGIAGTDLRPGQYGRPAQQSIGGESAGAWVAAVLADSGLDLDRVAQGIASRVAHVLADLCVVLVPDEGSGQLRPLAVGATDPQVEAGLDSHHRHYRPSTVIGAVARVLRSGSVRRLAGGRLTELTSGADARYAAYLEHHPLNSVVLAPITAHGVTIGVLACSRHSPHQPFGDQETALIAELAELAGLALANALLFAEQERSGRELERLLHLTESMLGQPTLDSLRVELLPRVAGVLAADAVVLLLVDDDGGHLTMGGTYGLDAHAAHPPIPVGEGLAGRIAATREPMIVEDAAQEAGRCPAAADSGRCPAFAGAGLRSLVGVPLLTGDGLVGVLLAGSRVPHVFSRHDLTLLDRAADRVAVAVRAAHTEQELRLVEARSQVVINTVPDAILTLDEQGRIESINHAGMQLFGYATAQVIGRNVSMLMPEPYRGEHDAYLARYRETGVSTVIGKTRELIAARSDGTVFPVELHVSEIRVNGRTMFAGVIRDISERRRIEDELRRHALHDPLTGLANRVLFRDRIQGALARQSRRAITVAVLFLDLDRFKVINDSLGHAAGDQLLIQVADRLRQAVRPEDTIARLGGDEFAVLLEDLDSETVTRIARRILALFRDVFRLDTEEVTTSTSIGVALSDGKQSAGDLQRHADAALYLAKDRGRNRFAIFDEPLRRWIQNRLRMENELRRAVAGNQLEVHYQPQRCLRGARDIGRVEALVRWRHPTRGLLPAADFIGLAEETGLIVPIGTRVIEEVARQQTKWAARFGAAAPDVAVNLSPQQLAIGSCAAAIAGAGGIPDKLWVEVTESTLMADIARTASRLADLKNLGARIAIDDFGTGHSSLAYLKRFPIDAIKIDRTFVEGIGLNSDDTAIVSAIVNLGHTLHVEVVAEGVENERQLRLLDDLGCDQVQGWLISGAVPAHELAAMLGPRVA